VPIGHRPHDDALAAALRAGDLDDVAKPHLAVRLGAVAVDGDLAALAGALRLGPRLEEARDVEPDVEAEIPSIRQCLGDEFLLLARTIDSRGSSSLRSPASASASTDECASS
jgi:hypothetical protein